MSLHGWGNYPEINPKETFRLDRIEDLKNFIGEHDELVPFGNGRSYGDSALAENIIKVRPHSYFLDFDETTGILHVQSGVMLSEIIEIFVPRGWFLKVTPGTKLITVGGAIAGDVHGKNHHLEGCFSESVEMLRLMLPDGKIVECSNEKNSELFKASCGGMGLTGVILDAEIRLRRINSKYLNQTTVKTKNLRDTFESFEKYRDNPFSVAWLDCLAKGDKLGRGLLMFGDFRDDGELDYQPKKKFDIPFYFPSFVLSGLTIKTFNELYYLKARKRITRQKVDLDSFFYPLDAVGHWNKIYGRKGFAQYQFILPKKTSFTGLRELLEATANSGKGSFLAVLKLYGPANDNYLSFPMEGYGLALDFKIEKGLFDLFNRLDRLVLRHGGRFYLAKDARVSKEVFEKGYPQINKFRALRKKYKMDEKFNSLQSERVGI